MTLQRKVAFAYAVILALVAINFDFSGIPAERLTLIGDENSPLPWPTLLTGMIFIQMYYWGTNQTITQRAMAAPNVKEAQKGVLAAASIRILVIPLIVAVPVTRRLLPSQTPRLPVEDWMKLPAMVAGVLAGSAAWWLLLTGAIAYQRQRFTPTWRQRINQASAVLLGGFALWQWASLVAR